MEIKDKNGISRIVFENFKRQPGKNPIFVDLDVLAKINDFDTKTHITAELTDFSGMLTNLNILNKTLSRTFYFQHIDEQVTIKFEPLNTGIILISGSIRSKDYSTSLEFKFETDQSCLPELIRDCKEVVSTLS